MSELKCYKCPYDKIDRLGSYCSYDKGCVKEKSYEQLREENEKLKAQLKEKGERIEKLQEIIDDVDDPYCFTTYCSGLIKEHDDEVKQKDAEIEKKDALLKEAVEVIKNLPCNDREDVRIAKDFLNKMEAGK